MTCSIPRTQEQMLETKPSEELHPQEVRRRWGWSVLEEVGPSYRGVARRGRTGRRRADRRQRHQGTQRRRPDDRRGRPGHWRRRRRHDDRHRGRVEFLLDDRPQNCLELHR